MLGQLRAAFQRRGRERVDVLRFVRVAGLLCSEFTVVQKISGAVIERSAIFQGAGAGGERKRLRSAEHVVARNFENPARTGAEGGAVGILRSAGDTLDFESETVTNGVAVSLLNIDHNSFLGIGPVGILRRHLDAVKNAQVVQLALR